jgi:hypothetical protein
MIVKPQIAQRIKITTDCADLCGLRTISKRFIVDVRGFGDKINR